MNAKLELSSFRKWLESKPKDKIVGIRYEFCRCPIAAYLADETGFNWNVYQTSTAPIESIPSSKEMPLPVWASEFIWLVDNEDGDTIDYDSRGVTASLALEILKEAEKRINKVNKHEIL